ncbi:14060_t:CDS:2, partial [Racocetra persica]
LTTLIRTLYCSIPFTNDPLNSLAPSIINNAGHLRGFLGSLYIVSIAFQTSELVFDVNATVYLYLVATSINTKDWNKSRAHYSRSYEEQFAISH